MDRQMPAFPIQMMRALGFGVLVDELRLDHVFDLGLEM